MLDANGLEYRLRLMNMREPWRDPLQCIHDIAYENLKDIDLRVVLFCLRDMRYQPPLGGDTIFDSLNEWCATAVTKHFAIHNLLSLLGLKPTLWMTHYAMYDGLPLDCPILIKAARKHNVQGMHVFITCNFGAGERIVDFTYPQRLAAQHFVVTNRWNIDQDCLMPYSFKERRQIEPNAQGLLQIRIWEKQLNPGMAMHYNTLIQEHIYKKTACQDIDEPRARYIHRQYVRQLPPAP